MSEATLGVGAASPCDRLHVNVSRPACTATRASTPPTLLSRTRCELERVGLVDALAVSDGCGPDEAQLAQVLTASFQVGHPMAVLPRARVAHVTHRGPVLRQALRETAPTAANAAISEVEAME